MTDTVTRKFAEIHADLDTESPVQDSIDRHAEEVRAMHERLWDSVLNDSREA